MSFDLKFKNGDLMINNGDLVQVRGVQKLQQDLLKICLTEAGANPLQPWYGSLVSRNLIGNYLANDILIASAKTQLQKAIENLKSLQDLQVSSGQKVTPDEQISFIKGIDIVRSTIDPRAISITVRVLSRAFGQVSATFEVQP